jgi:hypothetical protein
MCRWKPWLSAEVLREIVETEAVEAAALMLAEVQPPAAAGKVVAALGLPTATEILNAMPADKVRKNSLHLTVQVYIPVR